MKFKSINPYNGKELETFQEHSNQQIEGILEKTSSAFTKWRETPFSCSSQSNDECFCTIGKKH